MIIPINDLFEEEEFKFELQNGFKALNSLLNGFGNSELIILAGRPRNCSAALLRNIAIEISKVSSLLYISPSFSSRKIFLTLNKIKGLNNGSKNTNPQSNKTSFLQKIWADHNIFFLDNFNFFDEIKSWMQTFSSEYKRPFIIIESLNDIIYGNYVSIQSSESQYLEILRSLKNFSNENQVPIMLHVSLPEVSENIDKTEPKTQDLEFIGHGLSLIDKTIFTFRPNCYKQSITRNIESYHDIVEIMVPINKSGNTGCVSMEFISDNLHFKALIN